MLNGVSVKITRVYVKGLRFLGANTSIYKIDQVKYLNGLNFKENFIFNMSNRLIVGSVKFDFSSEISLKYFSKETFGK